MLQADFDILAAVPDGRQALECSLRLDPDLAVLDISMPGLDGFQTLQELRRAGSRVKVVLLTMHESDAYVAAAIASGAQGYVVKTRLHADLVSAIEHVLDGRIFVPSLTSLFDVAGLGHAVQFHSPDHFFLDEASQFVSAALRSGEPVVLTATNEMRTGLSQRLKESGLNLKALAAKGLYAEMDAAEGLSQFMRDGAPNAKLLAGVIKNIDRLRLSVSSGPASRLTIFGDMTVVLCREGNFKAAAEVERMWSRLTSNLPFLTVCSYPAECFRGGASDRVFANVCAEHRVINHALIA
jgi:CheY-like chemotaxis protein